MVERPLDMLNLLKGKDVVIELSRGDVYVATLLAFDIHINLAVDNAKEVRGETISKSYGLVFFKGSEVLSVCASENKLKKEFKKRGTGVKRK